MKIIILILIGSSLGSWVTICKRSHIQLRQALVDSTKTISVSTTSSSDSIAFPGAEGGGRFATGCRVGTAYEVTNLDDAGSGSLRDAVRTAEPECN